MLCRWLLLLFLYHWLDRNWLWWEKGFFDLLSFDLIHVYVVVFDYKIPYSCPLLSLIACLTLKHFVPLFAPGLFVFSFKKLLEPKLP